MQHIHIAAALVLRADGAMLVVRKRGSAFLMLAGGKIDGEETPVAALLRELEEELGITPPAQALQALGHYSAVAANEPDSQVHAHVFLLPWAGDIAAANEIEEARWITLEEAGALPLAPLARDSVIPLWAQQHAAMRRSAMQQ